MPEGYQKLFSYFKPDDLDQSLLPRIMGRLQTEQKLRAVKKHLIIRAVVTGLSLPVLFVIFQMVSARLHESGFTKFLLLLFSDFSLMLNYWQSYVFSLLETLPVVNLMIFLAISLVFLESLKLVTRDIRIILRLRPVGRH